MDPTLSFLFSSVKHALRDNMVDFSKKQEPRKQQLRYQELPDSEQSII